MALNWQDFYRKLRGKYSDAKIKELWAGYKDDPNKLPLDVVAKMAFEGADTPERPSRFNQTGAGKASKEQPSSGFNATGAGKASRDPNAKTPQPSKTGKQKREQLGLPTGTDVPRGGTKSYG